MIKRILEQIKIQMERENAYDDIEVFENLLGNYVLTFWTNDDEQYMISIEKVFDHKDRSSDK